MHSRTEPARWKSGFSALARMRRSIAMLAVFVAACNGARQDETTVEVVRVAPAQLLGDSLEVTPRLDTTQNAPEQGMVALSIEVHVRNAASATRRVPQIGFHAVAESGLDTAAQWRFEITRRTVDSLRAGESATFGLTTSPGVLAADRVAEGVFRVEAVFSDSMTGRHTLPLGRIRLTSRRPRGSR